MHRGNRHGHHFNRPKPNPRPPFDVFMVEDFFPKVGSTTEIDTALTQVCLQYPNTGKILINLPIITRHLVNTGNSQA